MARGRGHKNKEKRKRREKRTSQKLDVSDNFGLATTIKTAYLYLYLPLMMIPSIMTALWLLVYSAYIVLI
jgi:hypothetical protein